MVIECPIENLSILRLEYTAITQYLIFNCTVLNILSNVSTLLLLY